MISDAYGGGPVSVSGTVPRRRQARAGISFTRLGEIALAILAAGWLPALPVQAASNLGTWTAAGQMLAPVSSALKVEIADGTLYVIGGTLPFSRPPVPPPVATVQRWSPASSSWASMAPLRQARSGGLAAVLKSGQILVAGGSAGGPLAEAEIYEPTSDSWRVIAPLPRPLRYASAVILDSGRVQVFPSDSQPPLQYDPQIDQWALVPALSTYGGTPAVLPDGRVLLVGGFEPDGSSSSRTFETSLRGGETWTLGPPLQHPRQGAAVFTGRGVITYGGLQWQAGGGGGISVTGGEVLNLRGPGHWDELPSPPAELTRTVGAVQLDDGRLVVTALRAAGVTATAVFDPVRSDWVPGPDLQASLAQSLTLQGFSLPGGRAAFLATDGTLFVFSAPPSGAGGSGITRQLPAPVQSPAILVAIAAAAAGAALASMVLAARRPRAWRWLRPPVVAGFQLLGLVVVTWVLVAAASVSGPAVSSSGSSSDAYAYGFPARELALLREPVLTVLALTLTRSLALLALAAAWSTFAGMGAAVVVVSARKRRFAVAGVAATLLWVAPTFVLAILVQEFQALVFGKTGLVVAAGYGDISAVQVFWAAVVLGIRPAAYLFQQTRTALESELDQEYARTALAKGLSFGQVVSRHLLAASTSRLIANWVNAARLMVGALPLVEFFFGYPGLGRILVLSLGITASGRPGVVSTTLAVSLLVGMGAVLIVAEAIAGVARTASDPRLRRALI